MRLKKGHFLGKVIFTLLMGLLFLSVSHLFSFAASSPMSLNLEKSIQIALESNIGYKITESTVDVSQAQVKEAEGAKKLNMKLQGGYLQMSATLEKIRQLLSVREQFTKQKVALDNSLQA